jgi:hypothetical protein
MSANPDKDNQLMLAAVFQAIDQQEISAYVTFPEAFPIAGQGMI